MLNTKHEILILVEKKNYRREDDFAHFCFSLKMSEAKGKQNTR